MVRKDKKKMKAGRKNNGNALTTKEKKFIREYLKDFNGTRAYMNSYKTRDNPGKRSSAGVKSCHLLKDLRIMSEIDKNITAMFSNLDIQNESILAQQAIIAFIDSRSFFNEDETFKKIKHLNIAQQSAIESIEVEELYTDKKVKGKKRKKIGRIKKVRFYSRQKALDNLMKYKKLIGDGGNSIHLGNKNEIKLTIAANKLEEKLGADGVIKLRKNLEEAV